MSAPSNIFTDSASEGYFSDLKDIFTEEELSLYEEFLVFTTDPETNVTYPCAFDLSNNSWIKEYNYYDGNCYFGILYNCPNLGITKDFLKQ